MNSLDIQALLKRYGLVCHTFGFNQLPKQLQTQLNTDFNTNFNEQHLSLIANVGSTFWDLLSSLHENKALFEEDKIAIANKKDWVDQRSLGIANELVRLSNEVSIILYPGNTKAPLIQLGELAGWSSPSPLGLGVHHEYGPWLAYRALIVTDKPLVDSFLVATPLQHDRATEEHVLKGQTKNVKPVKANAALSPCIECDAPCVQACPSDAVSKNNRFNIGNCADYRVKSDSICKTQCHARNACPVGANYQYQEQQLAYHMSVGLAAIVEWANQK